MTNAIDSLSSPTIAIIMTCHNRRDTTLACLQSLDRQELKFDVYLVDDGSSDGTTAAVCENYPQVKVLQGNGELFWAGGMRVAFGEALKADYDYYVWLNDDTLLHPTALSDLFANYCTLSQRGYADSIVAGSTQDAVTGQPTYGGAVKSQKWYSNKLEFLQPASELQECDTMYGNFVLIPRSVAAKVGNIDSAFVHCLGDIDYGLRARQLGCTVWAAPGFIGTCSQNPAQGSWTDPDLSAFKRLTKVVQIKNFPILPWTTFTKRHSGSFWFLYWFLPYVRALIGYKNLDKSPAFTENVQADKLS